ncbi:hypothetical protein [Shewanella algae]|uniref:hypothetical protein n=1 Tax=Shewanella algae TaxID=38313 RepID=UPI00300409E1
MENFRNHKRSKEFDIFCKPYLLSSVEQLFDCEIEYCDQPISKIQKDYGIDLLSNPKRGTYIHSASEVTIIGRVLEDKSSKYAMSLTLKNGEFSSIDRLLNVFEAALSLTLSRSHKFGFADRPSQFGQELIELFIAKYYSKGFFDHRRFLLLMELFKKLATTSFEGRNFTTGLIITKSHYAYAEKGENYRGGKLYELNSPRVLDQINMLDKRLWYLSDGQSSFFVCNKQLEMRNCFVLDDSTINPDDFNKKHLLSETLLGADALLRVTSENELSIVGASGIEFNYKENRWRIRDLRQISKIIKETLNVSDAFVQALLYYVFYLSKRRFSSIIWIPTDLSDIDSYLMTKNNLTNDRFSILDMNHKSTLLRLFSSDGASVININGDVISFGSVIDISKASINGVKGTGESVSTLLGENGMSVKISQDGKISLFGVNGKGKIII